MLHQSDKNLRAIRDILQHMVDSFADYFSLQPMPEYTLATEMPILPTTKILLEMVARLLGEDNKVYVLGKRYACHQATLHALKRMGKVNITMCSHFEHPAEYQGTYQHDLEGFHEGICQSSSESSRLLLVDQLSDLKNIFSASSQTKFARVAAIEENKISKRRAKSTISFPVVDVASSYLKAECVNKQRAKRFADCIFNNILSDFNDIRSVGILCHDDKFCDEILSAIKLLNGDVRDITMLCTEVDADDRIKWTDAHDNLVRNNDAIISITGYDITGSWTNEFIEVIAKDKQPHLFINASEYTEFSCLIQYIASKNGDNYDPFQHLRYGSLTVSVGGFPCELVRATMLPSTYDNAKDFCLTRAISLAAILQCMLILEQDLEPAHYQLDSSLQLWVVRLCQRYGFIYQDQLLDASSDAQLLQHFELNSAGFKIPNELQEQLSQFTHVMLHQYSKDRLPEID